MIIAILAARERARMTNGNNEDITNIKKADSLELGKIKFR